jgi:hypothetical protein
MVNEIYLLPALHRLANGQDENFVTETLAFVLRYLINREQQAAIRLLRFITADFMNMSEINISTVDVKTQVSTKLGRPNLILSTDNHLAYVEVKVDANFGDCQLKRYRDQLNKTKMPNTKLIALTRYPLLEDLSCGVPDHSFRWHNLADFVQKLPVNNSVSLFIISEFLSLLTYRGLTVEKVSWEMIPGIKALIALIDMLAEALAAKKLSTRSSPAQEWRGFYIVNKSFFVGIYFNEPGVVVFNTEVPLNEKATKTLKVGKLQGGQWRNELDLTSEEIHFFARSRASQVQCLEQFIDESLAFGKTLI